MSFVTTQPEMLSAAAGNLQRSAAKAAATTPTTGVVPAAADAVSALTATQFAAHASLYQEVSAPAAAMHDEFTVAMGASAGAYAATEAAYAAAAG
ncbi:PE family protein [Mycobacterium gordonae]|uniref:PE family protein n=1 Tax=Mycobacterium gordonae TaxID=1778 RepID=A0A1A6BA64_MYCGO|nr:PE family protein [Mycobacterium gordonae]OBR99180.1 PE family protein [Mycobacterium gordonae]